MPENTKRISMSGGALVEGLLLAAAFLISLREGVRLYGAELVTKDTIGPGGYLLGLSSLFLISSLGYLLPKIISRRAAEASFHLQKRTALCFGCLIAYAFLIPWLGYLLSSALFFFAVLRLFGFKAFRGGILALLFAAIFYAGFVYLAHVPLPEPFLGR
jgi:hypothetical protein